MSISETRIFKSGEIEVHSYYGHFFYCPKCKGWRWFDRIVRIKGENVWEKKLFYCEECGTVVDWNEQ
jgi:RNase P subunit RPR2